MKRLSVMAIPAKENKEVNPYNYILYSKLEQMEVQVLKYDLNSFLKPWNYDLVRIHWPENFIDPYSSRKAKMGLVIFLIKFLFLKLFGKKLVWTVHNAQPHENNNQQLMELFYKLLYKYADGLICLTEYGARKISNSHKRSANKVSVIAHPHYSGYYPNNINKHEARNKLMISEEKFVFLFIGQVRKYKNVIELVDAFKQMNCFNSVLIIAGKIHDDVANDFELAIKGEKRIIVFPSFIEDNDLRLYLNCADLVVNPFKKILNSGSVFLNLSFSRPTMVPNTESLLELKNKVGSTWIKTYEGSLTSERLQECKEEVLSENRQIKPDLSHFEWQMVAQKTKSFYKTLMNKV